jgi:ethanolamine transporter EutH
MPSGNASCAASGCVARSIFCPFIVQRAMLPPLSGQISHSADPMVSTMGDDPALLADAMFNGHSLGGYALVLFFRLLARPHLGIETALFQQCGMRASLSDPSGVQHDNLIRIDNRR